MPIISSTKVFEEITGAVGAGYTTVSEQGSSRSGKTYNTLIWLVTHLLRNGRTRLSVVRATLPALQGSVFMDFKDILERLGIYDPKALNKTELTYKFPNGSWVEFFSSDDEQKLRGRKRDVLFVNEANELSFLEWQQLKMRTTQFAILDYNPSFSPEHWICSLNNDPRTYHFITTYKDNPFLEQTIIDEIEGLRDKNANLWHIYGEGLQAVVEGLVFPNFDIVKEIPPSVAFRRIGMDFGYTNDPTAIVEVALEGNDMYLDELVYRTHMLAGDIISELKAAGGRLKIISESADPRLVEEIYRAGVDIHPVKKFQGSVEAGIAKMQEFKIHVTARSVDILRELRNYTYRQDKEGRWLNSPVDCFNHAIDAARYVILNEVLGGARRSVDTERLMGIIY